MRIRNEHVFDGSQPVAGRGVVRRLTALLLALALLAPAAGLAQGTELRRIVSSFSSEAYPVPFVPEREAVGDDYFADAIIVGDSMVEAIDLYGVLPEITVYAKIGVSAKSLCDSTYFEYDDMLMKMFEILIHSKPKIAYLWVGSNGVDIKKANDVLQDYDRLLNELISGAPNTLFYCISLPPVAERAQDVYPEYTNANVVAFNYGLSEICRAHGVYYIDAANIFYDEVGNVNEAYVSGDGIHLNREGYQLDRKSVV